MLSVVSCFRTRPQPVSSGRALRSFSSGFKSDLSRKATRSIEAIAQTIAAGRDEVMHDIKPLVINGVAAPPLVVYFIPISKPARLADQILPQTRAIVLAIEPKVGEPADPALVRDLLGVTLGEARVAALIGAGIPPRETAQRLGIAEETARNLLKRVFSKAGVSRQSELAALLGRIVVHSSPPDAR